MREMLEIALEEEGHRTAATADGKGALALVSGNAIRPDLVISDFLLRGGMNGLQAADALRTALGRAHKPVSRVVWLVGPEGDFTPDETSIAVAAGFIPVTFGPLVLRCDTAATYALSVVNYELQGG